MEDYKTHVWKSLSWLVLVFLIVFMEGCIQSAETVSKRESNNVVHAGNEYFLENLRFKAIRSRGINVIKTLEVESHFTRYLIKYESDGINISGMMNVPKGHGLFPVVILNHGYYDPRKFSIGLGFRNAADIFARHGYVAIGSDYRNHGSSDKGPDFFQHMGSLYDVLYLVEAVKELPYVDKERIGMWGYSKGGWITLKASVISKDIKVIALFGSMSSDDRENYYALEKWHPEVLKDVRRVLGKPEEGNEAYKLLSPISYIRYMSNNVIIHHGEKDEAAPLKWSEYLREALIRERKTVEFYVYPGQGHVLKGEAWDKSMERTVNFFNRFLRN